MNIYVYLLAILLFLSCNKQPAATEFAQGKGNGIVGKWKLMQARHRNAVKEAYLIAFDSTGRVTASDFPCAGSYTFNENGGASLSDRNLIVSFTNCKPSSFFWYSIKGMANARLTDDNNTLVLNSPDCDEGCSRLYKRIRD